MRTIIFLSAALITTAINPDYTLSLAIVFVLTAFLAFGWDMVEMFYNWKKKK